MKNWWSNYLYIIAWTCLTFQSSTLNLIQVLLILDRNEQTLLVWCCYIIEYYLECTTNAGNKPSEMSIILAYSKTNSLKSPVIWN